MRQAHLLLVCLVAPLALLRVANAQPADQSTPATQPTPREIEIADEAAYRAHVSIINLLLDDLSADEMLSVAKSYRFRGEYDTAAVHGLIVHRLRPDDPHVAYELACNFSLWGQKLQGIRFFELAAEKGYWGYRITVHDTDLDAIKSDPKFEPALSKIKLAFEREAPKHPPGMTVVVPKGDAPAEGWPVLVSLHGWGSSRQDFDDLVALAAEMGYVGISLDGTEVLGPASYQWTRESTDSTHQRVLQAIRDSKANVNMRQIILHGFSQGAMHAARVLADNPGLYRGAICNSPGSPALAPEFLHNTTGPIYLTVGTRDFDISKQAADMLRQRWDGSGRKLQFVEFEGGHQLPRDQDEMLKTALQFINDNSAK